MIKTDEVINWRNLIEHFEQDLKIGDSSYPATDAFKSEEGAKRWNDFKTRIVEHVILNKTMFKKKRKRKGECQFKCSFFN